MVGGTTGTACFLETVCFLPSIWREFLIEGLFSNRRAFFPFLLSVPKEPYIFYYQHIYVPTQSAGKILPNQEIEYLPQDTRVSFPYPKSCSRGKCTQALPENAHQFFRRWYDGALLENCSEFHARACRNFLLLQVRAKSLWGGVGLRERDGFNSFMITILSYL